MKNVKRKARKEKFYNNPAPPAEAEVMPMGKWQWARAGKWCAPGKMNKAPTHNNAIIIIDAGDVGDAEEPREAQGRPGKRRRKHRQWGNW